MSKMSKTVEQQLRQYKNKFIKEEALCIIQFIKGTISQEHIAYKCLEYMEKLIVRDMGKK